MKFSIKDFFSNPSQIRSFLQIWSHLLKKSLIENFIFFPVLQITTNEYLFFRSSRPEVFYKIGALKNFAKYTGKHLCQSLCLVTLQALGL